MVEHQIVVYEERNYCIYAHVNKINGKKYIGQTGQNPEVRWGNGRFYIGCPVFFGAINKYGWDGFYHVIVKDNLTKQEANLLEQVYIQALHSKANEHGYNIKDGGNSAPGNFKDLTGQHFGRLTVLYRNGYHISQSGKKKTLWRCVCSCEKHMEINVMYSDLVSGNTTSCGCIQWENRIKKRPNKYELTENPDVVIGYTNNGNYEYIIDLDDFEKVSKYTWYLDASHKSKQLISEEETNGHRVKHKLLNIVLGIPNDNGLTPNVEFINGKTNDYRKSNIRIIIPENANRDEYIRYVYMGGIYHLSYIKQSNMWRVYYDNCKHSKSFKHLDDAIEFWQLKGDKMENKSMRSKSNPIICLNSLEIIQGGTTEAVKFTDVKRAAIDHSCHGRNEFGGRHLVTGEKLKWMKLSDYESLSCKEKEELQQKYYTGNKLVSKEEL